MSFVLLESCFNFRLFYGVNMSQPTIFVDIDSQESTNPLAMVIKQIAIAFGATSVDQLVSSDDVEVTIAITNSVARALTMVKKTERTVIVIWYYYQRDCAVNDAFASRHPDRVYSINLFGLGEKDEMSFAPFLIKLIAEKAKELEDANPTC